MSAQEIEREQVKCKDRVSTRDRKGTDQRATEAKINCVCVWLLQVQAGPL